MLESLALDMLELAVTCNAASVRRDGPPFDHLTFWMFDLLAPTDNRDNLTRYQPSIRIYSSTRCRGIVCDMRRDVPDTS